MAEKNDKKRMATFDALKAYMEEHHLLPNKNKIENRALLS